MSRSEVQPGGFEAEGEEAEEVQPHAQGAANRHCCRCPRCSRCRACAMKTLDGAVWLLSTMFEVQAADSVSELLDVKMAMVNRCITSILDEHWKRNLQNPLPSNQLLCLRVYESPYKF